MGGDFRGREQDATKGIYALAGEWAGSEIHVHVGAHFTFSVSLIITNAYSTCTHVHNSTCIIHVCVWLLLRYYTFLLKSIMCKSSFSKINIVQ